MIMVEDDRTQIFGHTKHFSSDDSAQYWQDSNLSGKLLNKWSKYLTQ